MILANETQLVVNFSKWQSIFGFVGDYKAENPLFRAVLSELSSQIKLYDRQTGVIVTTNNALTRIIKSDNKQPLVWEIVDQLLLSLYNQAEIVKHFGDWGILFGLGVYTGNQPVQRALVAELEASIKLGPRVKGNVITAKDDLSGVNEPVSQDLIWDQNNGGLMNLLQSLDNQERAGQAVEELQAGFSVWRDTYVGSGTEQAPSSAPW